MTLARFSTERADRDTSMSGKKEGVVLVISRWSKQEHIHIKESMCSPDVELVDLRPYYLPQELTNIFAINLYIPSTGRADTTCHVIHSVTADLQTKHPDAFIFFTGDFFFTFPFQQMNTDFS